MEVIEGTVEQVHVNRARIAWRDESTYRPADDCPLAQAIREQLGSQFRVGCEAVTHMEGDTCVKAYTLDEASVEFARRWDLRRLVDLPHTYRLTEVPDRG